MNPSQTHYRHSITAGIGGRLVYDACELVQGIFAARGKPVTLVRGHGFHPAWGGEPVLTAWWVEAMEPLADNRLREAIREALGQEAVFYTIEEVRVA